MLFDIDARYVLFEAIVLVLFVACLRHAWRRDGDLPRGWHVGELLGGLMFGLLLEWINVEFVTGYQYGRLALMLGSIPISIGMGWSIIIYSSMLLTDRWGLPNSSRPDRVSPVLPGDAVYAVTRSTCGAAAGVNCDADDWLGPTWGNQLQGEVPADGEGGSGRRLEL